MLVVFARVYSYMYIIYKKYLSPLRFVLNSCKKRLKNRRAKKICLIFVQHLDVAILHRRVIALWIKYLFTVFPSRILHYFWYGKSFTPSEHSRLCSKHFEVECFTNRGNKKEFWSLTPSQHCFPFYLKKVEDEELHISLAKYILTFLVIFFFHYLQYWLYVNICVAQKCLLELFCNVWNYAICYCFYIYWYLSSIQENIFCTKSNNFFFKICLTGKLYIYIIFI